MFKKLERTKVFRDPLYGYIEVDYELISLLIDSLEVQRLRRIRQLSGVSQVFQTAEHSRFTHSLGAYEMARQVLLHVRGVEENFNEYEKVLFLASALLHDIGHGPYSHAFESVLKESHEDMTVRLILSDTEVNSILSRASLTLPSDIAGVILHKGKYKLIESLISSQLDVDRMDYLSRDAYFTGATYGIIDKERILRSMIIKDKKLYIKASGVNSIESYLMSRYHMYWQVYYHGIARSYELILQNIYKRIFDLSKQNIKIDANIDALLNVMKDPSDIKSYVLLDDSYVNGMIKQLINSKDIVLSDLAKSIEKRYLYSYIELNDSNLEEALEIEKKYQNSEFKDYYFAKISVSLVAYLHTNHKIKYDLNDIKILKENGEIESLENYSKIIEAFIDSSNKKVTRVFYKELPCKDK